MKQNLKAILFQMRSAAKARRGFGEKHCVIRNQTQVQKIDYCKLCEEFVGTWSEKNCPVVRKSK